MIDDINELISVVNAALSPLGYRGRVIFAKDLTPIVFVIEEDLLSLPATIVAEIAAKRLSSH